MDENQPFAKEEYAPLPKVYLLNNRRHREDGPAVEHRNGSTEWWLYGKLHRIGGPAIDKDNGTKEWWVHGKRHRLDGPAIEFSMGTKVWFIDGENIPKEEFESLAFAKHLEGEMIEKPVKKKIKI